jgi:hypothetical protein
MPPKRSRMLTLAGCFGLLVVGTALSAGAVPQASTDPQALLKEADRLAWLRAWGAAERLYAEAGKLFGAQGDQANALYSEVSVLRGQLPRLPDSADDRATLLRATTQEIASTRDGVLDAVMQRLELPQKHAAEAYTLAEQHETNPRSVWGYVQGLTRLSQRTSWQGQTLRLGSRRQSSPHHGPLTLVLPCGPSARTGFSNPNS